jgi:two-component system, chemotaxis family, protein-glutamate methylesterase/glutaminase
LAGDLAAHDIIVIGASAGGVEALMKLVKALPVDLEAAVFVVIHVTAEATSTLPAILRRAGPLPAHHALDGEAIAFQRIYVAPPDNHMVLRDGRVRIVHGPRENRSRPAIDPLFRSAAITYGSRVIGVVLSGSLDDGTAGLYAIKSQGGLAIVQDPDDALVPGMPRNALENMKVDYRVPVAEMGELLATLTRRPAGTAPPPPPRLVAESEITTLEPSIMEDDDKYATTPSPFTCPECHGTLWEIIDGDLVRYRCRVGHSYSTDSMVAEQAQSTERALWAALRSLEEKAALSRRLSETARMRNHLRVADQFAARASDTEEHAETVRRLLLQARTSSPSCCP